MLTEHAPPFANPPGLDKHQHNAMQSGLMQIYALPYGGIGFTVHLLAYYNISMVAFLNRSPLTFQAVCYPRFSQTMGYMSCIGFIILGSYHVGIIGKIGAVWMVVISIWHSFLSMLFAAAQTHIISTTAKEIETEKRIIR